MPNSNIRINSITEKDTNQSVEVSKLAPIGVADGAVIYVETVADLQALDTSGLVEGQVAMTLGGKFVYADASWTPSGPITPRAFGAVPGEVCTEALQSWVDDGGDNLSLDARYLTENTLEINKENVSISGISRQSCVIELVDIEKNGLMASHKSGITLRNITVVIPEVTSDTENERVAMFDLCPNLTIESCGFETKNQQSTYFNHSGITLGARSSGKYPIADRVTIRDCFFKTGSKPILAGGSETFGGYNFIHIENNFFDCSHYPADGSQTDVLKVDGNGRRDSSVTIVNNRFYVPSGVSPRDLIKLEEGYENIHVIGNHAEGGGLCRAIIRLFHAQKDVSVNYVSIRDNVARGLGGSGGAAIYVGTNDIFESIVISGNHIDGFDGGGVSFWSRAGGQGFHGLVITDNIFKNITSGSQQGESNEGVFYIRAVDGFVMSGNVFVNCDRKALIRDCEDFVVSDNVFKGDFNVRAAIGASGSFFNNKFLLSSSEEDYAVNFRGGIEFCNNRIETTTTNAIQVSSGAENVSIKDNVFDSEGASIRVFNNWDKTVVKGNKGFITKRSFIATLADNEAVDHLLDQVRRSESFDGAEIVLTSQNTNRNLYLSSINEESVRVRIFDFDNNPVTDAIDVRCTVTSALENEYV